MEMTDREFIGKYLELDKEYEDSKDCYRIMFFVGLSCLIVLILTEDFLFFLYSVLLFVCSVGFFIRAKYLERQFKKLFQLDKNEAKCHYEMLLFGIRYFSMIQRVCAFNPDAKYSQREMVKNLYGFDDAKIEEYFVKRQYGELDLEDSRNYWKNQILSDKKAFAEILFKFVILEDGIHNDEWKLMMEILNELNFNKNYISLFARRYGPLRTEFEADEQGEKQSTENIPVSQLKAYFAILGLEEGASDVEIKKAYHNLALQHHPDLPKNADRVEECETMMARINEAYEKIRN